jgi:hypothetical protein
MTFARACVAFVAFISIPALVFAADAKAGVLQNPAPLDDDFFLQGEYTGAISSVGSATGTVGVQVIALGKGKFEAVEFSGGLPGNGGDRETRRKYTGQMSSAGTVELSGGPHRLTLRRGSIAVKDDSGKPLGVLRKTQRMSQTLRAAPPPGAKVLFIGRDARQFTKGNVTPDHLLVAGADTKVPFGDFTMHLEFRTPYMPEARGQGRGNSGVYIQGRYEVQILDSFGLAGADNECGSLYKQRAPLLNMSFPPLIWQTYDIDFTAPRFDAAGKKMKNARITVRHNGVVVQNDVEVTAKTGGGAAEGPDPRPIKLQDHGNPVHFRNVWIAGRKGTGDSCDCQPP